MHLLRALTLLSAAAFASASRLVVAVTPSQLLPNPSTLPPSTHAVLLGPPGVRYDTLLRQDNTFVFSELVSASYLLTIHTRDFSFPPLRVDVKEAETSAEQTISAWQTFRGNEWSNKGPEAGSAQGELTIYVSPKIEKDFYQKRAGFSILSFLKSPMILMGLVSVVMIVGIPYLMENMDPEMKAEMEAMQNSGSSASTQAQAATEALQNFDLAGWMAGKTANSDSAGTGKKK